MGRLLRTYIFPHPPVAISDIGGNSTKKVINTINACRTAAQEIELLKPTTIIVITPHGAVFQDAVCISTEPKLSGNFSDFRCPNIHYDFTNNNDLVTKIIENTESENIRIGQLNYEFAKSYGLSLVLDHGALVPLHFIKQYYDNFSLVHINMGFLSFEDLYLFGTCIAKSIEQSGDDVVMVASGDLSHRVKLGAPAGYNPRGKEFDNLLVNHIRNSSVKEIISMDNDLIESAGECGLRPFIIMYGALDGKKLVSEVLSYEAPFGVGYCIARIEPKESVSEEGVLKDIFSSRKKLMDNIRNQEDSYTALARITLETYIKEGRILKPGEFETPEEMLSTKAGVFVSIKKHNQLRGCIGTIEPTCKNIAEEIINNAISAGVHDYRFSPVKECELEHLVYSVDVLKKPEPISSKDELDPLRYGVIVSKGLKKGLLLPNIEGVNTVEEQVSIALKKAGIGENEKYNMQRFEVIRHN